jgi:hypothetical protein
MFVLNNCHVLCAYVPQIRYKQQRYNLNEETRFTVNISVVIIFIYKYLSAWEETLIREQTKVKQILTTYL